MCYVTLVLQKPKKVDQSHQTLSRGRREVWSGDETTSGEASPVTPPLTTDEITAEIPADVAVVRNLKELEISFGRMLVQVKRAPPPVLFYLYMVHKTENSRSDIMSK